MWKNMGTNSNWNVRIDDTMVVDVIVMTTCMSPFLTLIQCQNFPRLQTCLSTNVVCAFLWGNFTLKVIMVKATLSNNHNANMHILDLSWSYLQFDQRCHNYWTPLYKCSIYNSKIQIIHHNNVAIVQNKKIKKITKMNLTTNKWSSTCQN